MAFFCYICEEESTHICARCTKDSCDNHLCERCHRCSDCCECEVRLSDQAPHSVAAPVVVPHVEPMEAPQNGIPPEPVAES